MANIIIDNSELEALFVSACDRYKHISFVTAWAGVHPVIDTLYKNSHKIKMSVVGLHFYQTSPQFIIRFSKSLDIQYIKRMTTDVFHPKVYLFYNNENEWEAIVGSSNLTGGGFSRNVECNVHMSSNIDTKDNYNSIKQLIADSWVKSEPIGDFLNEYIKKHQNLKLDIQKLKKPLDQVLTGITWREYIDRLILNDGDGFDINTERIQTRLTILRKSEDLFSKMKLKEFNDEYPLAIAGLISEYDGVEDWRLFATTRPNGRFFQLFKTNLGKTGISDALDNIPLKGDVTKKQFDKYVSEMRKVTGLDDIKTIATRFLAMKRPDIFVCLSSQNKEILDLLGVGKKNIKLDEYWDLVITKIQNSTWYNVDSESIPKNQLEIFKYRAAMLDALYYKN
jgi:HKD family nuclease